MISPRGGPAFIVMRIAAFLALVFCSACNVAEEDLGPNFAPVEQTTPVTGACGTDPSPLAQIPNLLPGPFRILPSTLYVVSTETPGDTAHETLWQVPMVGGAPKPIATGQANIAGIDGPDTLPDGGIVWTSAGADDAGTGGAIWTLDSSGAPAVLFANRAVLGPIVLDYDTIYWVEEGIDPSGQRFGAIMQGSTTPGDLDVTMFQKTGADQTPWEFGFLAGGFAWNTKPPPDGGSSQSALITAPSLFPFGAQTEIAGPDGGGVGGFAFSDTPPRYFYSGPSGIMVVVPPAAPRLLLPLSDFVYGMVDLEGVLYFVLPPAESLWAVPDDGDGGGDGGDAGMRQLVSDVGPEGAFAVDSRCLYWIDVVTSSVMMVHK